MPYYTKDPKRDHNFDNRPHGSQSCQSCLLVSRVTPASTIRKEGLVRAESYKNVVGLNSGSLQPVQRMWEYMYRHTYIYIYMCVCIYMCHMNHDSPSCRPPAQQRPRLTKLRTFDKSCTSQKSQCRDLRRRRSSLPESVNLESQYARELRSILLFGQKDMDLI